jgi:Plavaka transposase
LFVIGKNCDKNGIELPADTPPPPHVSDRGPNNWRPYNNRVKFEVADFFFHRNQMSAEAINFILSLWAASLAPYNNEPPFSKATCMYNMIDKTPLGDVPWQSVTLQFNGIRPADKVPSWMDADYNVWFRDPRTLVHNILSSPDFKGEIDLAPFQEHSSDGAHQFQNFMSGLWAWKQAVGHCRCLLML